MRCGEKKEKNRKESGNIREIGKYQDNREISGECSRTDM